MTPIRVKGLVQSPNRDEALLMLQTVPGDRILGLLVPMSEATRLSRVLGSGGGCRCSPVYELLLKLGGALETTVARAVLDANGAGIGGRLVFLRDGVEIEIECHPADAVGLAVRSSRPIYATPHAIGHACRTADHPGAPDVEPVHRWLDEVKPADFEDPPAARR